MVVADGNNKLSDRRFLLQKIEKNIDARLFEDIEPDDDEISLIGEYQERKKSGTLIINEI